MTQTNSLKKKLNSGVVVDLKITDIDIRSKDKKINRIVVEEHKKSIKQVGLLSPIVVNTGNKLVARKHRLVALTELGEKVIPDKLDKLIIDTNICDDRGALLKSAY